MVFDWDFSLTENADAFYVKSLPNAKVVRIMGLGGNDRIENDIYSGSETAISWIDGGDGNDTILGGFDSAADTILGGTGNDLLSAGALQTYMIQRAYPIQFSTYSKDRYYAATDLAKNVLLGGLGSDTLYGGLSDDLLIGGEGNDTVYGDVVGSESNRLDNNGSDTLIGGAGVDNLSGGAGANTFIFATSDSGVGKDKRDIITDFDFSVVGEVMDLSAIAGGTLSFVGTTAFNAINQVRYEMDFVNSTTIVKLNLDSDPKTTEMEIELTGFKNLTADDFVLVKA